MTHYGVNNSARAYCSRHYTAYVLNEGCADCTAPRDVRPFADTLPRVDAVSVPSESDIWAAYDAWASRVCMRISNDFNLPNYVRWDAAIATIDGTQRNWVQAHFGKGNYPDLGWMDPPE